jgi:hypothetical protein
MTALDALPSCSHELHGQGLHPASRQSRRRCGCDTPLVVGKSVHGGMTLAPVSRDSDPHHAGEILARASRRPASPISRSEDVDLSRPAHPQIYNPRRRARRRYWDGAGTVLAPRESVVRMATGRDAADASFLSAHAGAADLLRSELTAVVDGQLPADDVTALMSIA